MFGDGDFNFVIAGVVGAGGGVGHGILRVQLAANFVDSFVNGEILEGGEVLAAGSCGCQR
jgi:hypothetical protein